jgi:hypothetical protein
MKLNNLNQIVSFALICYALGMVSSPVLQKQAEINFRSYFDSLQIKPNPVAGKKALFIGDSHTSAYGWGWQDKLCQKTGMKPTNTAMVGKQTDWMMTRLKKYGDSTYSYCFIYGGGNDIAAGVSPQKIYRNISYMVSYAEELGMQPVVITGSDPSLVIKPVSGHWRRYINNKAKLQNLLADSLQGAVVIDVRDIIEKRDCADFLCHMKMSGHEKISNRVINKMGFVKI